MEVNTNSNRGTHGMLHKANKKSKKTTQPEFGISAKVIENRSNVLLDNNQLSNIAVHKKGYLWTLVFHKLSGHSDARSWSIPSEDPYEEAARQLLEQAPRSLEYVPDPMELEDHVPVYIPEPEHPEDLVPAEDEAPTPPLPPFFLSPRIRPPHTRAAMRQMRAAAPSTYHSLLLSGTPPLLPIPLPAPSTSRRANIPEVDIPPRKRLLLTTPRPGGVRFGEESAAFAAARQPGPTMAHRVVAVAVREFEVLTHTFTMPKPVRTWLGLEAHCRALEARVTVLETEVRRHEWQRQAADDLAVQYIIRTQALEAGAHVDTLEDTGSSS
ncbi:hypothetical protein Tco_0988886 [Tanacetum coccineum]|uniref:Uncharacterized protein n=1 Tax=Tanacetum coccineum TaxID=301880 RepID=A0ABQ5ETJ9_9ASTR